MAMPRGRSNRAVAASPSATPAVPSPATVLTIPAADVCIEHNLDVIKTADHLIDLGPEGGDRGGQIVVTGTPEQVAEHPTSYTGYYLKPLLVGHGLPPLADEVTSTRRPRRQKAKVS